MNKHCLSHYRNTRSSRKAFTLFEIIITITLLGILAGLVMPRLTQYQESAKFQEAVVTLDTMVRARTRWMIEHPTDALTDCSLLDVRTNTTNFGAADCSDGVNMSLTRNGGAYEISVNGAGCFSCSGTCPQNYTKLIPTTAYCTTGTCSPVCNFGQTCINGVCVVTST